MAAKTTTTTPSATAGIDTSKWNKDGRNVMHTTLDGFLFIAVPISDAAIAAAPASKSGKSKSVGSTEGNVPVPGTGLKFGLNVYQPV